MNLKSRSGIPQRLKPFGLWLGTARLKPRPFKEYFLKHALVPAKGFEYEM